jgi:cation:H+ antiporter
MIAHVAILAASLFALVKSADYLVEYAARLARRFQVSELVVGLVITSVGTSLPEMASSLSAVLAGSPGLVIGNVVGSNIANIGLVLGLAAAVHPFATEPRMYDRDGFILLGSAVIFFLLALDNLVGRFDAALLLVLYVAYVVFAARTDRAGVEHRFRDFLKFVFEFEYAAPLARRLTRRAPGSPRQSADGNRPAMRALAFELLVVVISMVALIVSARYVVAEAIWLATVFQLPDNLIGLSLVAVGTSLPELTVSISAAKKGKAGLIVGNVMGSNIANILLIIGVGGLVRPIEVAELSVVYTIPIMLFFSLALLHFLRSGWHVTRLQGVTVVAAYVAFLGLAFWQNWG